MKIVRKNKDIPFSNIKLGELFIADESNNVYLKLDKNYLAKDRLYTKYSAVSLVDGRLFDFDDVLRVCKFNGALVENYE